MGRPKNAVPTYRLHKQSGQAIVTVNVNGDRKDMTLGAYNSAASKEEYRRVLESLANGTLGLAAPADLTVNELCARYWKHAEGYYTAASDGKTASELSDLKYCIREFRGLFGDTPAREFGPLAFKALRERMVKKGWARPTVNAQSGRVKRIVRWGVENELLPADRWEALRAVPGLQAGRTAARDPEPVLPVDEADYRAVAAAVTPKMAGLLELLEVTGMRPGEACRIKPCEVEKTGAVWVYRPGKHKTKNRGKKRAVPLGAKAQAILARFEPPNPEEHYFCPSRGVDVNRYKSRKPRACYDAGTVATMVGRTCVRIGVKRWHPNQLRHLFATKVRRLHGLEAAQVLLGHARADITQIYAETNLALAAKVAGEIG